MKRHPRLQPLSDDHHRALVLARMAKRSSGADAWREIQERFARELEPHFRIEEDWLFPELETAGEIGLAARARGDHARLREQVRAAHGPTSARELGALLEAHVRFEERELFPRMEIFLDAYEDASARGLCREGALEVAVGALRAQPREPRA